MRFAAISDIHGNFLALEAVLEDIASNGVTNIVNLGDSFSGPLDAQKTADLLIPLGLPTIAGNHDRQLLTLARSEMGPSDRLASDQLDPAHLDWLRGLPPTLVYRDKAFLCHGTPASDLDALLEMRLPDGRATLRHHDEIVAEVGDVEHSLILCGHTHEPRSIRLRDGRQIVNPGSVGGPGFALENPRRIWQVGSPDARYAILAETATGWDVTFRNVPYDNAAMARLAAENGDADWQGVLANGWLDG